MTDDTDFITETRTLITAITDRDRSRNPSEPHGRALAVLWDAYVMYLSRVLREKGEVPGIPIFLTIPPKSSSDHPRLRHLWLGPHRLTPDWFQQYPRRGGTEVFWQSPVRVAGNQFWIMSWRYYGDDLWINVSHWLIHRDHREQRITIYFSQGYQFSENMDIQDTLITQNTRTRNVSDGHRRMVHDLVHSVLTDEQRQWPRVIHHRGVFEEMNLLQDMVGSLDLLYMSQGYLHTEFRKFWLTKARDYLYGGYGNWRWEHIDTDAFLRDTWYAPNLVDPWTRERYERNRHEWLRVREAYDWWKARFREALIHGETDLSDMPDLRNGVPKQKQSDTHD